jgi:hypothetical protein
MSSSFSEGEHGPVTASADVVGLWALDRSGDHGSVVFDAPPPAVVPAPRR